MFFFPLELNGIWQHTVSVRSPWGSRSNWFRLRRDWYFQTGRLSYWQCISVSQRGSVAWKCQNRQNESVQFSRSWLHKDLSLKSQRQGALRPTFRPPRSIADAPSYSAELSITFTGLVICLCMCMSAQLTSLGCIFIVCLFLNCQLLLQPAQTSNMNPCKH